MFSWLFFGYQRTGKMKNKIRILPIDDNLHDRPLVKEMQSERDNAIAMLRESEAIYHSLYEYANLAILLTAPDGNIFSANKCACDLFGMTEEALCLAGRDRLLDTSDPRIPEMFEERARTGQVKGELSFIKADGTRFPCEFSSSVFLDKNGQKRTSTILRDLTSQKKAEGQLRMLSKTIEQSPVSIAVTNADATIEFVNARFVSIIHYTLEEVKGKRPRIFNPGHSSESEFNTMWETINSGKIWYGEQQNRKKEGTLFWESVLISPLFDEQGLISNYIVITEDITEKKKMIDDLVEAKEKAEESDRLKTAFLHNISHEIRTPMNAIVGFSGLLKEPDIDPHRKNQFVDAIIQSSNNLLAIITDILQVAIIEAGQSKLNESEVNLNATIRLLYEQFTLNHKNQETKFDYQLGLPDDQAVILTDVTKLTEILMNLIGNALKFTDYGRVEISYILKEKELLFQVSDTGIGISPEMHEEIFMRFRQAEHSLNRSFGGSGLGLSISKAYVEQMGGKIWLRSSLGRGSTFYFSIPYKKPDR
jgi:PAS domain S-box-containing protein